MEKRKGRRILYKLLLIIIVGFLSYIIIFNGVKDYFDSSDNLWYPIFQSILFLMFIYLITFRIINPIVYTLYSDVLYLFKKKEITIIKENNTYSIVKTCRRKEYKFLNKIFLNLTIFYYNMIYIAADKGRLTPRQISALKHKQKTKTHIDAQEWLYSGIFSEEEAKQKIKNIEQEKLKQQRKKKLQKLEKKCK